MLYPKEDKKNKILVDLDVALTKWRLCIVIYIENSESRLSRLGVNIKNYETYKRYRYN